MDFVQAIAALIEAKRDALGVVHLGLYGTKQGLVLSWSQSLEAIAEPSEHHYMSLSPEEEILTRVRPSTDQCTALFDSSVGKGW